MPVAWPEYAGEARLDSANDPAPDRANRASMEEQLEKEARRGKRSKWRRSVWFVLVGCVAFLSYVLTMGLFSSADLLLRLEVFAGLFVLGCTFLAVSRYSARKKRRGAPDG